MTLDLLFLNDVHGYLEPHAELFYNNEKEYLEEVGGYARIASLIKELRQNNSTHYCLMEEIPFMGHWHWWNPKVRL